MVFTIIYIISCRTWPIFVGAIVGGIGGVIGGVIGREIGGAIGREIGVSFGGVIGYVVVVAYPIRAARGRKH